MPLVISCCSMASLERRCHHNRPSGPAGPRIFRLHGMAPANVVEPLVHRVRGTDAVGTDRRVQDSNVRGAFRPPAA